MQQFGIHPDMHTQQLTREDLLLGANGSRVSSNLLLASLRPTAFPSSPTPDPLPFKPPSRGDWVPPPSVPPVGKGPLVGEEEEEGGSLLAAGTDG